jgi:predicted MFS family arabinose efflux permease
VQIAGGFLVPYVRRLFRRRTDALLLAGAVSVASLLLLGTTPSFVLALVLLSAWSLLSTVARPMRAAYVNGIIPSDARATVLSFDSLLSSAGGVVAQPALGRVADQGGYGLSYVVAGAANLLAIPFVLLARRERASSDPILETDDTASA